MKKVKNNLQILPVLCLLLFLNSCVSLSSMQSARTTPKGDVVMGVSVLSIKDLEESSSDVQEFSYSSEMGLRFGVNENLDIGTKFAVGAYSSFNVDTKWQFVGDQESFFAVGTGLGLGLGLDESDGIIFAIHFPLYTSIHPTEKIAVFLNPRGIFVGGDITEGYYGASMGAFYGKKLKFGIEASLFQREKIGRTRNSSTIFQAGIGMIFNL